MVDETPDKGLAAEAASKSPAPQEPPEAFEPVTPHKAPAADPEAAASHHLAPSSEPESSHKAPAAESGSEPVAPHQITPTSEPETPDNAPAVESFLELAASHELPPTPEQDNAASADQPAAGEDPDLQTNGNTSGQQMMEAALDPAKGSAEMTNADAPVAAADDKQLEASNTDAGNAVTMHAPHEPSTGQQAVVSLQVTKPSGDPSASASAEGEATTPGQDKGTAGNASATQLGAFLLAAVLALLGAFLLAAALLVAALRMCPSAAPAVSNNQAPSHASPPQTGSSHKAEEAGESPASSADVMRPVKLGITLVEDAAGKGQTPDDGRPEAKEGTAVATGENQKAATCAPAKLHVEQLVRLDLQTVLRQICGRMEEHVQVTIHVGRLCYTQETLHVIRRYVTSGCVPDLKLSQADMELVLNWLPEPRMPLGHLGRGHGSWLADGAAPENGTGDDDRSWRQPLRAAQPLVLNGMPDISHGSLRPVRPAGQLLPQPPRQLPSASSSPDDSWRQHERQLGGPVRQSTPSASSSAESWRQRERQQDSPVKQSPQAAAGQEYEMPKRPQPTLFVDDDGDADSDLPAVHKEGEFPPLAPPRPPPGFAKVMEPLGFGKAMDKAAMDTKQQTGSEDSSDWTIAAVNRPQQQAEPQDNTSAAQDSMDQNTPLPTPLSSKRHMSPGIMAALLPQAAQTSPQPPTSQTVQPKEATPQQPAPKRPPPGFQRPPPGFPHPLQRATTAGRALRVNAPAFVSGAVLEKTAEDEGAATKHALRCDTLELVSAAAGKLPGKLPGKPADLGPSTATVCYQSVAFTGAAQEAAGMQRGVGAKIDAAPGPAEDPRFSRLPDFLKTLLSHAQSLDSKTQPNEVLGRDTPLPEAPGRQAAAATAAQDTQAEAMQPARLAAAAINTPWSLTSWEQVGNVPYQPSANGDGEQFSFVEVVKKQAAGQKQEATQKPATSRFAPGKPADLGPLFVKAKSPEGMSADARPAQHSAAEQMGAAAVHQNAQTPASKIQPLTSESTDQNPAATKKLPTFADLSAQPPPPPLPLRHPPPVQQYERERPPAPVIVGRLFAAAVAASSHRAGSPADIPEPKREPQPPQAAPAKVEKKRWWETDAGAETVEQMQDIYGGRRREDNTLEVNRELDDFDRLGLLAPTQVPMGFARPKPRKKLAHMQPQPRHVGVQKPPRPPMHPPMRPRAHPPPRGVPAKLGDYVKFSDANPFAMLQGAPSPSGSHTRLNEYQ